MSEADPADQGKSGKARRRAAKRRVLMSGLITAIGIALHNFPEGVAVFLASMKSTGLGVSIACAIALHNIPEGVAVALPVYFATGSRYGWCAWAWSNGRALEGMGMSGFEGVRGGWGRVRGLGQWCEG